MVQPYVELRENTANRDRSLREKVMSLAEAAALVNDGEHVALGGCTMSRTPLAMIWALIRARKTDLMISRSIVSTEGPPDTNSVNNRSAKAMEAPSCQCAESGASLRFRSPR